MLLHHNKSGWNIHLENQVVSTLFEARVAFELDVIRGYITLMGMIGLNQLAIKLIVSVS